MRQHILGRAGIVGVAILQAALGAAWAADPTAVNLLRLPAARIEASASSPDANDNSLTDGDASSVLVAEVGEETPLTVVFHFQGATVSPERLVVTLPEADDRSKPAVRVELLVSNLSAHASYQSVRSDPRYVDLLRRMGLPA